MGTTVFLFTGLSRQTLVTVVPLRAVTSIRVKVGTMNFSGAIQEAVDSSERSIIFMPLNEKAIDTNSCNYRSCDGEGSWTKTQEVKGKG